MDAITLMKENISKTWVNTDMGSGWVFKLYSPLMDDIGFTRREDNAILFDSEGLALDCITIFYFYNRVVKEMIEIVKVYV